ncbi:MAG TPA: hypothetical protein DEP45_09670 [Armatimonadetes bacterium]|nr:hypothetical protein [Armatimonadota bacterium]
MLRATSITTWAVAAGIASLTLATSFGAYAQIDDGRFFIESFARESVAADGTEGANSLITNPNDYNIDLTLPSGLALHRSFARSEVSKEGLAFDTAINALTSTGATLTLGGRTSMSFSREEKALTDVFDQFLEGSSVTTMSLSQGFGGGSSSGEFTLKRSMQSEQSADTEELRTLIQSMAFKTGLGDGMSLSAGFTSRESQESATRLQETGYNADLKMALSGGEGVAHYDYLQRLVEGQGTQKRQLDLVAPFAIEGGTLTAEHHLKETITDRTEQIDRETKLVVPLSLVLDGATASYVSIVKIRNDNRDEKNTLTFMTPFDVFGHAATFEHIQTETIKNEDVTDERVMRLAADFDGSKGIVEHTSVVESSGEDLEHRARLRMQTPNIDLTDWMSLTAQQVRDEVEGDETSRVSRVDLSFALIDPLEIKAIYTRHEEPGKPARDDHDIRTVLAISDTAMLKGGIEETAKADGSPSIVRHLELTKKAGNDLDVRVGYTSFGAQFAEAGGDMLAQLNYGDPKELGISAFYTEFDDKKLKPLDEPTTTIELRAGDPAEIGFRAAFSDQAGRPEPERSLGLATEVMGGALKFDYIRNPLDPSGKTVMLSDVYELGFKRQVMGSVALDLGYRYFVPRAGEALDNDQYFRLQLDGGSPEKGGQIALKYVSGQFVPYPKNGQPPASLLDLTYEKRWPDNAGRLTLSLEREEAPDLSVGVDDTFEAEVKYEAVF